MLKVYCVFDSSSEVYSTPFYARTNAEALHSIREVALDKRSVLYKYPADHTLFCIGEYDPSNGVLITYVQRGFENLGNVVSIVVNDVKNLDYYIEKLKGVPNAV